MFLQNKMKIILNKNVWIKPGELAIASSGVLSRDHVGNITAESGDGIFSISEYSD